MTRRRSSNKKPTGVNKSLGNSLLNERERARQALQRSKYDVEVVENPAFMEIEVSKCVESITDETSLEEFLAKAQLAGTEFTAEREEFCVVDKEIAVVIPSRADYKNSLEIQRQNGHKLRIPRRPAKELYHTAEELRKLENECFLKWRSDLAEFQERDGLVLTPFERNPELWRELWRVVERSDVVVQVVDARNPLLFWSKDLDAYVKEVDPAKEVLLLINKADLLEESQLASWANYFTDNKINAVFWSALEDEYDKLEDQEEHNVAASIPSSSTNVLYLHTRYQLIQYLKVVGHALDAPGSKPVVVGMVGYPNVGKSSTINKIAGVKKVSVAATPGKTRHFQTVHIDAQLCLCDCPGLIMPSFAFGRSEMFLNGILPVDQMRDYLAPVSLLLSRVPASIFEHTYSIMLPENSEPTASALLTSIAFMRGFMSASGIPDCSRAARFVIKDVVNGKLRWAAPPPNVEQENFNRHLYKTAEGKSNSGRVQLVQLEKRGLLEGADQMSRKVDNQFFHVMEASAHIRSIRNSTRNVTSDALDKEDKRHYNKNRKQKLRRIYGSSM